VHPLGAWVIPRRNELLCVLAGVRLLVVHLTEWARDRHVAVINVESTQETHILIVVMFVHIEEVWVASLLLHTRGGGDLCNGNMRNELAMHFFARHPTTTCRQ
jgi:hypothetical protein